MDPSTSVAQDVHDQTQSDQSVTAVPPKASDQIGSQTTTQPKPSVAPTPQKTQQISVTGGGGLEAGSAILVAEDADDEDEDEALQVAPQEKKNLGVMGQGEEEEQGDEQQIVSQPNVADVAEEVAEIQPAVPEVVAGSPEVEKFIEITPPEQPKITSELKNIGVTHSGLGIIDVSQVSQTTVKLPITYEQAVIDEGTIKSNKLHTSKYWLLEKVKYIWRKINPEIAMTTKQTQTKKVLPAKPNPAQSKPDLVPAETNNVTLPESTNMQ